MHPIAFGSPRPQFLHFVRNAAQITRCGFQVSRENSTRFPSIVTCPDCIAAMSQTERDSRRDTPEGT